MKVPRRCAAWSVVGAAICLIAGCGASTTTPSPASSSDPAAVLAQRDGQPDSRPYAILLTGLALHCTQDQATLAGLADSSTNDLQSHGLTGDTRLTVLQGVADAIGSGTRIDCKAAAAVYVLAQETAALGPTPLVTAAPTAAPTAVPTAAPTAPPTARPTVPPTPPPTAPPRNLCGAPANPWNYNFCGGGTISSPPSDFCSYFNCIPSFWDSTNGYVEQCADGAYSHSGGRSGSCSSHGGNRRPLNP
jgi:hypothetical protein